MPHSVTALALHGGMYATLMHETVVQLLPRGASPMHQLSPIDRHNLLVLRSLINQTNLIDPISLPSLINLRDQINLTSRNLTSQINQIKAIDTITEKEITVQETEKDTTKDVAITEIKEEIKTLNLCIQIMTRRLDYQERLIQELQRNKRDKNDY